MLLVPDELIHIKRGKPTLAALRHSSRCAADVQPLCSQLRAQLSLCTLAQVRLSERNVVELIGKLQAAGLLGDDLLHSVNGREYLTQEHLRSEVQGAVESSGGRIPVVRFRPHHQTLRCGAAQKCP